MHVGEMIKLGEMDDIFQEGVFKKISRGGNGIFKVGEDGVRQIYQAQDEKADFILYKDKTLVCVKSAFGQSAFYEMKPVKFEPPATKVLMDLDGTSVNSEKFWIWIIERTIARLMKNDKFELIPEDEPHVSGHSVSEHLQYCIDRYCPGQSITQARTLYTNIVSVEMNKILEGKGRTEAFEPCSGLREFLLALKANNIEIGLVTSGSYEKAWPEIVSVFRQLDLGDPLNFYDSIMTAGYTVGRGRCGTLGELAPKPHPWLYAETAKVGLSVNDQDLDRVIGIEDSSAGVLSLRLAGFPVIGMKDGNIRQSGMASFVEKEIKNLTDALPFILGK